MNILPNEILEVILSFSTNNVISQISKVNKYINGVIKNIIEYKQVYDIDIIYCEVCNNASMTKLNFSCDVGKPTINTYNFCSNNCRQKYKQNNAMWYTFYNR